MKEKILEIVRAAMRYNLSWDNRMQEVNGEDAALDEISTELDKILPITPQLWRTKGTAIPLSEEDIAKLEACGFIYDKERNLMIRK